MFYNPTDWYWIVNNSTTVVYSSTRVAYVPVNDAIYVAWLARGNVPSNIGTSAELLEVLQNQWVATYLGKGVAVRSTGTPSLNATYALDPQSQFNLTGVSTGIAAGKGLPGGGSTFFYNGIEFTGPQFLNLATALESYVYSFNIAVAMIVQGAPATLPPVPLVIT